VLAEIERFVTGNSKRLDDVFALCEHRNVNVLSAKTIRRFAALHPDAAGELLDWYYTARRTDWRSLTEVREVFSDADQLKCLLIFNVRHNRYRLIVKVDYRAHLLMVKEFLTHTQYMKGAWKKWAQ